MDLVELHRGSLVLFYIHCYQTHFSLMLCFQMILLAVFKLLNRMCFTASIMLHS